MRIGSFAQHLATSIARGDTTRDKSVAYGQTLRAAATCSATVSHLARIREGKALPLGWDWFAAAKVVAPRRRFLDGWKGVGLFCFYTVTALYHIRWN